MIGVKLGPAPSDDQAAGNFFRAILIFRRESVTIYS